MAVTDLITNLKNGDNVKANKEFEGIMADKMTAALDARKVEIASSLVQRKQAEKQEEE
jgi:hypothetical protein